MVRAPVPESHLVALTFEVTEFRGGRSAADRVTITSVERDSSAIYVNYEIVPPPDLGSLRAQCEAKDDLGNDYHYLGGHFGITRTSTALATPTRAATAAKLPLPPPEATMLRIRIRWEAGVIRMPWDTFPPIDLEHTSPRSPRVAFQLIEYRKVLEAPSTLRRVRIRGVIFDIGGVLEITPATGWTAGVPASALVETSWRLVSNLCSRAPPAEPRWVRSRVNSPACLAGRACCVPADG